MLILGGKVLSTRVANINGNKLFSIATNDALPAAVRSSKAFMVHSDTIPNGFAHYFIFEGSQNLTQSLPAYADYTILPKHYEYLGDGDIVRISPGHKSIRVLFRASSPHNSFLVTEQCNHYCLMCSQPPKQVDDSWILDEIREVIPLVPKRTQEIGFTGGEPTIYGEKFLDILQLTKNYLPRTSVHILSNGRRFSDIAFASRYAEIFHPDIMVGIPIYSDDPTLHDYIVQAKGAFDETIRGVLNLKRFKQQVEIRIVLHKQSIKRLRQLAEFLARNLRFVDQVALMGLEMTGFTRANLDGLWIDPLEYKDQLSMATKILATAGIPVSVYNHQLCLVNPDTYRYCRKSISDWKNEYAPECDGCLKQTECGGFFSSAIRYGYSKHITPIIS